MRIIYTIGFLAGVLVVTLSAIWVLAIAEDFLQRNFGKPPLAVAIIGAISWLFIFARLAWEQVGNW